MRFSTRIVAQAFGFAAAALALLHAPKAAVAGVYSYTSATRTLNCAILLADSAGQQLPSSTPTGNDLCAAFPFYILNQRIDVKPVGWNLTNPLAPGYVTQIINDRFGGRFKTGQQVAPNMAPYWELSLQDEAEAWASGNNPLQQFDLLVIHTHRLIGLSRDERQMLREYVDKGGTLWIEDCGSESATNPATTMLNENSTDQTFSGDTQPGGLFLNAQFQDFSSNSGFAFVPDPAYRFPLLTTPYFLSNGELNSLGDKDVSHYFLSEMSSISTAPDPYSLLSVLGNSGNTDSNKVPMPYYAAGDYGSGHILFDNADTMDDISNPVAAEDATVCTGNINAAHLEDLKLLVNLLSWASNTSSTDGVNPRHTGFQNSPLQGGVDKVWNFPSTATGGNTQNVSVNSSGASIFGNIAYVTSVDSNSAGAGMPILRAFDLIPDEDLDNDGDPDDGINNAGSSDPVSGVPFHFDWNQGLLYDELWAVQVGPSNNTAVSPPTICRIPYGTTGNGYSGSVLVENDSGSVFAYDTTSDPQSLAPSTLITGSGSGAFSASGVSVPAPTYYHGWLVAAQPPNGSATTVAIRTFVPPGSAQTIITLDTGSPADSTPIVSSPVIATIPSSDGIYGGDDIVCYVATQQAVYSIFLGSRDEKFGGSVTGGTATLNTKLTQLGLSGASSIVGAAEDAVTFPGTTFSEFAYINADPTWLYPTPTPPPPYGPEFRPAAPSGVGQVTVTLNNGETPTSIYGDYDVVPQAGSLTRHTILSAPSSSGNGTGVIEGICVGQDNILYATVNEPGLNTGYIEAINEQPSLPGATSTIRWRFLLTRQAQNLNGDGIDYELGGYRFIGPPVTDGQYVYAEAFNSATNQTAVLCFTTNPEVDVVVNTSLQSGQLVLQQTIETGAGLTLQEGRQYDAPTGDLTSGQTNIRIKDFNASGLSPTMQPNITVPLQVTVSSGTFTSGTTTTTQNSLSNVSTNRGGSPLLRWCRITNFGSVPPSVTLPAGVIAQPGPLRDLGGYLYFANGFEAIAGNGLPQTRLQYIDTATQGQSASPVMDASTGTAINAGLMTKALVASGTYAVAPGTTVQFNGSPVGGIEGVVFGQTLIADNNRIIEIDSSGNASWVLDSTQQQAIAGDVGIDYDAYNNPGAKNAYPGATPVVTQVSLSRPSSLTQLSDNDLLFADTGNNRCVRVDRSGNVLWELTNFRDKNALLAPGQSLSLNHPTSVSMWSETVTDNTGKNTYTVDHYIVSDAGNYRVLEITDTSDHLQNGTTPTLTTDYHVLRGVTHTYDKNSRQYRFVSALKYVDAHNVPYIIAAVANTQIAPLVNGQLDVARKDSNGSSIAFFPYQEVYSAQSELARTAGTVNSFSNATIDGTPIYLVNFVKYIQYQPGNLPLAANAVTIPIRNLRFMTLYLPPGSTSTANTDIMIADDDGIFDGYFVSPTAAAGSNSIANEPYINATGFLSNGASTTGYSFTAKDYANMMGNEMTNLSGYPYPPDAFTPASAQRLANGFYLITNGASTGDARPWDTAAGANNAGQSGGCVFEIDPSYIQSASSPAARYIYGRSFASVTKQGLTLGFRDGPDNSGPLSQPAFAISPM